LKSLRYGINARGMYLLMGAIAGPSIIDVVRKK
jgi:hypothetical protein